MSKEERESRRDIAHRWWLEVGQRIKEFLFAYNAMSRKPPIPDGKITELHKSAMDTLHEEAKIVAAQVIAYEHVWNDWDKETCDKMYDDVMEIDNALNLLEVSVDRAARTARAAGAAEAREERLKDPWYKWEAGFANCVDYVKLEPLRLEPWGPHLPLTTQCLFSVSYNTLRDQRWRHLWEKDRDGTLGSNRNKRMDAKIEAEEDAAAATIPEKKRLEFQWQRAKNKRDAAWRTMNREQDAVEQGVGSLDSLAVFKVTLDKMDQELEVARLRWVEVPPIEATIS